MIPDAAVPVLAEALYAVGDEIGMNADADALFVARHLETAGWAVVDADELAELRDLASRLAARSETP
ncbi:hypothetical protein [Streptodolium elevatio]|uniref:Uncharacterized protein n=1 Tax=Streptodolium elevatio TaxID=3157996 RepID=A0ABV3DMC4_9ACTN